MVVSSASQARRRSKVLHEIIPKHTSYFKIGIKSRVKVGSKVKFWRFCMAKPSADNIDSVCSKLGQSNLKELVKIPCEHKCHAKYGLGSQGQVTKGHQNQKSFFGHAALDL